MQRRDFLLLRTGPRSRELELSCRWLYMKYLDTKITGQLGEEIDHMPQPYDGEPPAVFDARTPRDLFDELDRELRDVDAVTVTHLGWLSDEIRADVDRLLLAFRARGGRVQISS